MFDKCSSCGSRDIVFKCVHCKKYVCIHCSINEHDYTICKGCLSDDVLNISLVKKESNKNILGVKS